MPWLARRVGAPVRWTETRSENMVGLGHGRAQVQDVQIGGTRDGRILAYQLDVVQDAGAYPGFGVASAPHDPLDAHRHLRHPRRSRSCPARS